MTFDEFKASLTHAAPADHLSVALRALWHDACGDWKTAHGWAMNEDSAEAAWVHAYLHRKEGDLANAGHWYRRAGKPAAPQASLDAEWEQITRALLASQ